MEPIKRPNVHHAWQDWSEDQTLHVVATYINPFRYANRRKLFHDFVEHMRSTPNVRLHIVEVAFGDRPFEVTTAADIQLRSKDILWLKENALNVGIQRLPVDWKYAAYVDGDFHFTRQDWALEAIHQLQHHHWVQLYNSYVVMSEANVPLQIRPSFSYAYHEYFGGTPQTHKTFVGVNGTPIAPTSQVSKQLLSIPIKLANPAVASYGQSSVLTNPTPSNTIVSTVDPKPTQVQLRNTTPGATGGAWAFTRESFDAVGGLLDTCILGASDWYMSFGLVGNTTDGHPEAVSCGKAYEDSIRRWQDRAFNSVQGKIGYVKNFCTHGWHGDLKNRGYSNRWMILRDNNFDPLVDITKDWQGLLKWTGNKPKLEADVARYFINRNEDSTECTIKGLV